jgi:predicted anti-sigma-YlaC factor YlaD
VALTPRQQKKRQMVRTGYAGIGVGVILVILALIGGVGLLLGLIGAIVLLVSAWATRALREL